MAGGRLARTKGCACASRTCTGWRRSVVGCSLSTEYRNLLTRLRWQCAQGHIWEVAPQGLRQYGAWCPQCGFERLRLKIDDMCAVARERGGECLSQEYINNLTKLQWRCNRGHEWSTALATILADYWCPECAWLERSTKNTTRHKYLAVRAPDAEAVVSHTV